MDISPKYVLITGCNVGGIGASLAEVFLEKGYHVFATVRSHSKLAPSLSNHKDVTVLILDVLSSESIATAVESVREETGGRLDVLVNNAGAIYFMPGLDTDIEKAKMLFDINFWAPVAIVQAFAPLLINAKGCIVNNASVNAVFPMPFMSMYNASKAALSQATETWRHELQPLGVRTITLLTSGVKTHAFNDYQPDEIPRTSRYFEIRKLIYGLSDGHLQESGTNPREFSIKVVQEVEKGTSGIVRGGAGASAIKWISWLAPQWVFDMLVQSLVPVSKEMAKAGQGKSA